MTIRRNRRHYRRFDKCSVMASNDGIDLLLERRRDGIDIDIDMTAVEKRCDFGRGVERGTGSHRRNQNVAGFSQHPRRFDNGGAAGCRPVPNIQNIKSKQTVQTLRSKAAGDVGSCFTETDEADCGIPVQGRTPEAGAAPSHYGIAHDISI